MPVTAGEYCGDKIERKVWMEALVYLMRQAV